MSASVLIGGHGSPHTVPPEVLTLYEKGRQADESDAARRYFEEAVRRDPEFEAGWIALGNAYMWISAARGVLAPTEALARARAAADHAIRLDPREGEAHQLLGRVLAYSEWDLPAAEHHLRRAVKLSPASVACRVELAALLTKLGRGREAVSICRTALELDPLFYQTNVAMTSTLYYAGLLGEAAAAAERTLRLRENSVMALYYLGRVRLREKRAAEAVQCLQQSRKFSTDPSHAAGALALALVADHRRAEAEELCRQLEGVARTRYISPVRLAQVQLALGDTAAAFEYLKTGAAERDFSMLALAVDDTFDTVRADPRFVALEKKIGLPVTIPPP